jgi:hypothetical protein
MATKKINYTSRNFADIRGELIQFVRQYYPDIFNDFNDASVGMMLLELNAAVGDMLSFNTDRMFQETQLDFAQERTSILSMARTFGLKIPGKRPSVSIVDYTVTVPVLGDTWDISYAPVIRQGSQVSGAGKVFENMNDIDFSNPFTIGGIPNRLIIPTIDSNGNIVNYKITKREIVTNGVTKVFKRVITAGDSKPFLEVILPDNDIISISSVITLEGTNFTKSPTLDQFLDSDLRWYEMDALAESKVFVIDDTKISDNSGVSPGKFIDVDRRFIREYTDLGFTKIIFGGGSEDISSLCEFDTNKSLINKIGDFINNTSLGITLPPNQTMYIQYRVGGGSDTNLGPNTITNKGTMNILVNGSDATINNNVQQSLTVNNPIPALGGKNEPSVNEIRNLTRYNFSAQNRCVTIKDYQSRIALMPGEFGVPFRCGVFEEQNKIKVYILGLDSSSKLTNSSTSALRDNIATYLSDYRMVNDYVEVDNGRIVNLGFEIDLFVEKQFPQSQIMSEVISQVTSYMDVNKFEMGDNIYLSELMEIINNVKGVLNVIDMRVFNKFGGGKYSVNEIAQPYIDAETREIDLLGQFTLFGESTTMFECRFPDNDIKVRVKTI